MLSYLFTDVNPIFWEWRKQISVYSKDGNQNRDLVVWGVVQRIVKDRWRQKYNTERDSGDGILDLI